MSLDTLNFASIGRHGRTSCRRQNALPITSKRCCPAIGRDVFISSMQRSLFTDQKAITEHGGTLRAGKRKTRRAIALKRPMHVILKSDIARGALSLLTKRNARYIAAVVPQLANGYGVNVYETGNSGNHLHLAVKGKGRRGFQNFLRVLGSKLAIHVTRARKGRASGKFWTQAIYTRIVEWGRAFATLKQYVAGNALTARGFDNSREVPSRMPPMARSPGPETAPCIGSSSPRRPRAGTATSRPRSR